MNIEEISFVEFEQKENDNEGLVMLGAGGDPNDWINGITDLLHEEDIILNNNPEEVWEKIYLLKTTGGRIDLAMVFNSDADINIGKMATWRLKFGNNSWISDFLINYRDQYMA